MPYNAIGGGFERASRLGHAEAAVRALADKRDFFVPADAVADLPDITARIQPYAPTERPVDADRLRAAIAIDGSRMVERIRDGLPSVVYGYAQTAAAYLDLELLETQRGQKFVDPVELQKAVSTALVSLDLPCAGAYERTEADITTSWREAIDRIFRTKKVEVNNLDKTLLDLLLLLHGAPGAPATSIDVNCPHCGAKAVPVSSGAPAAPIGEPCPSCGRALFLTDVLRIHEEVVEEGTNESPLSRLMSVVELLVLVGLTTLLWDQHRHDLLPSTLFIIDGPLALYGPPAPLRSRALTFFQTMTATTAGNGPFLVGLEKTGTVIDYARQLAYHEVVKPGELLVCDNQIIARITNTSNPLAYGKETYWGRKFIYCTRDGRVLVPTVMPAADAPYDTSGGQPGPSGYPTLPALLDVFDRTGSSMYPDGIIPVALAHGKAAFPIGVGTDVLRLVARRKLGLEDQPPSRRVP